MLTKARVTWIAVGVAALVLALAILGLAQSKRQRGFQGCPFTGDQWGQPITLTSEYEWAVSSFGAATVARCWPGSHD